MALADSKGHESRLVHYTTAENFHVNRLDKPGDILARLRNAGPAHDVNPGEVAATILESQPDLIAFSCVTDNFPWQSRIAAECKRLAPGIPTLFGGIHITSLPYEMLKRPEVDAVAIGEADVSFPEFLERCRKTERLVFPDLPVKGIIFKKGDALVGHAEEGALPDLNALPFPAKLPWMSAPGLEYMRVDYKTMASRGCPNACSYCFNSIVSDQRGKRMVRRRSVENVIRELVAAREANPQLRVIQFWDDCFSSNLPWLRQFKDAYLKEVNLPFKCIAIPELLTDEAIVLLKEMGCYGMQIGVQSVSEMMHKDVFHRRFDRDRIAKVIRSLNERNIEVYLDHILGAPHDTVQNQEDAVLFYSNFRLQIIHAFWLNYYPRTGIADVALASGDLSQSEYDEVWTGKSLGASRMIHLKADDSARLARFIPCFVMLKFIPVLPRGLVRFLVKTRLYRLLRTKNFVLTVLLPNYIKECGGFGPFFRLCGRQLIQEVRARVVACVDRGVPDSRNKEKLSGSVETDQSRYSAAANSPVCIPVRIKNTGEAKWIGENATGVGVVNLGVHLYDAEHRLLNLDFARKKLGDVRPKRKIQTTVEVSFPKPGQYKLVVDLVSEGICWFEEVGSKPVEVDVTVH